MAEVINRLRKDKLTSEEFKYVSDIHSYDIYLARIKQENEENLTRKLADQKKRLEKIAFQERQKGEQERQKIEQEKQKAEQEKQKAEQEKQKAEQEKQKAEQEKQKAEQEKQKAEQEIKLLQIKFVKMFLLQGETIPKIAEKLELSIEKITELIEFIEKNKL